MPTSQLIPGRRAIGAGPNYRGPGRELGRPLVGPHGLTLTFEVTLPGGAQHADALEFVDAVAQLADEFATATVTVTTGPVPARRPSLTPVDPAATAAPTPDAATQSRPTQSRPTQSTVIQPRVIQIAPQSRSVALDGQELPLTRIEFDLLHFLARHPRRVFTRSQLLSNVWGHTYTGQRTVDVHIRRLRAWLGAEVITTVRGIGYRLASDVPVQWERVADSVPQDH